MTIFQALTIAAAEFMLTGPAARACDIEAVRLYAIYKRAEEVCGNSNMNTPVGMAIKTVADDCHVGPYLDKTGEAWAEWNHIVKQKGIKFACQAADISFKNLEKSLTH